MPIERPPAVRPATLRIDLDALARNYRMLRELAAPAECAAVVKADAYGLGVERVVRRLLREECRRFFVATVAEARELRAIASSVEIGVFEGALAGSADMLVGLRARPVLNTLEQVERWRGRGRALLHLDTGMNRLGLSAGDVAALVVRRDVLADLELDFVMTHLACADDARASAERRAARALRATAAAGCRLRRPRSATRPARCSMPRIAAISRGPESRCTAAIRSAIARIPWSPSSR